MGKRFWGGAAVGVNKEFFGGEGVSSAGAGGPLGSREVKWSPLSRISVARLEMSPTPAHWIKA